MRLKKIGFTFLGFINFIRQNYIKDARPGTAVLGARIEEEEKREVGARE